MNSPLGKLTIGRKVTGAVVIAVGTGCAALMLLSFLRMEAALYQNVEHDQSFTVQLLAANAAGGLRWNKPEMVEKAYAPLLEGEDTEVHAVLTVDTDDTLETLIKRADKLMYRSKATGRNRVSLDVD